MPLFHLGKSTEETFPSTEKTNCWLYARWTLAVATVFSLSEERPLLSTGLALSTHVVKRLNQELLLSMKRFVLVEAVYSKALVRIPSPA